MDLVWIMCMGRVCEPGVWIRYVSQVYEPSAMDQMYESDVIPESADQIRWVSCVRQVCRRRVGKAGVGTKFVWQVCGPGFWAVCVWGGSCQESVR